MRTNSINAVTNGTVRADIRSVLTRGARSHGTGAACRSHQSSPMSSQKAESSPLIKPTRHHSDREDQQDLEEAGLRCLQKSMSTLEKITGSPLNKCIGHELAEVQDLWPLRLACTSSITALPFEADATSRSAVHYHQTPHLPKCIDQPRATKRVPTASTKPPLDHSPEPTRTCPRSRWIYPPDSGWNSCPAGSINLAWHASRARDTSPHQAFLPSRATVHLPLASDQNPHLPLGM